MICCVTFWYYSLWTHTALMMRENVRKWTFKKYSQVLFEKIQDPCFPLKQQKKASDWENCHLHTARLWLSWCILASVFRLKQFCFEIRMFGSILAVSVPPLCWLPAQRTPGCSPPRTEARRLCGSWLPAETLPPEGPPPEPAAHASDPVPPPPPATPRPTERQQVKKNTPNICLSTHISIKLKTLQARSEVQPQSVI